MAPGALCFTSNAQIATLAVGVVSAGAGGYLIWILLAIVLGLAIGTWAGRWPGSRTALPAG